MFSYRHGFHAGNHADVLKHVCMIATVRHLMRKPTPIHLIDTHAGAGLYRLDGDFAKTSGEASDGVLRLWQAVNAAPAVPGQLAKKQAVSSVTPPSTASESIAPALADYLAAVASFNPDDRWRVYPGSPFLLYSLMNEPDRAAVRDRLKLFELHPTDASALQGNIAQLEAGRQISVARQDGFQGLKALLPPPEMGGSRRAFVLMDPSYEIKSDYALVAAAAQAALQRFATGVLMVWYPIIARAEAHDLPRRLKTLAQQAGRPWLHATLAVGTDARRSAVPVQMGERTGGPGLTASGVFLVNPPHTLKAALSEALPTVASALSRGPNSGFAVDGGG